MEPLFALTVGVAILEMVLGGTWNRFYLLVGVPIFSYETKGTHPRPVPVDGKELEDAMPDSKHGPIKVRKLTDNEFAFRESFWAGGFRTYYNSYTPVMHGKLEYTPTGSVQVTGLVNWFPVFFIILFVRLPITWGGENPFHYIFPVFLIGLLGWIYSTQVRRFKEVANVAASVETKAWQ